MSHTVSVVIERIGDGYEIVFDDIHNLTVEGDIIAVYTENVTSRVCSRFSKSHFRVKKVYELETNKVYYRR